MNAAAEFIRTHKRVLVLKAMVGLLLATSQYFPNNPEVALVVNLLWLFLF